MNEQDKYDHVKESRKEIFFNNIIGGIGWGLGATVGAAIILAFAGFLLTKVNTVPIIGDYVENILQYIATNQQTAIDSVETKVDKNK